MTINYIKPLVACNVILLVLCGYLIFQNQQLQRSKPPSSLHQVTSSKTDDARLSAESPVARQVESLASVVNQSTDNTSIQLIADHAVTDVAVTAEDQPTVDGIQRGSPSDEQLVSQQHVAAAALFQSGYSSTKEKLEALLVSGNYQ